MTAPPPPQAVEPAENWAHRDLWVAVQKAIYALPSRFESGLSISGVLATDLFAFNSSLGATIEEQVIASLNRLRTVWDPDQHYALYSFERQPQTFPDVVLKASAPGVEPAVILGIELKGWYVLAKEREPSFRYKVSPNVCAPADLLVVVPWALENVISGSPKVFTPFVIGAQQAANYRNWYWQHIRNTEGDRTITLSTVDHPYPSKSEAIADRPHSDSGNFGRLARSGIMSSYITELFQDKLAGIPLSAWQRFLGLFTESRTPEQVEQNLALLATTFAGSASNAQVSQAISDKLAEIAALLAH